MIITADIWKQILPQLEEADKALTQKAYRDIAMTAQTNVFFMMGMENPELMQAGFAEYNKILASFRTDMTDLVAKFRAGRLTPSQTLANAKNIFGNRYQEMFRAGTMAIGNPYYQDIGMTRKDFAFLNKARRHELRYLKRFLADIRNPAHKPVRHPYSQRAKYYAESGKAQFYNGMVAGAGTKMDIYWVLGAPQTKHCDVCPIYHDGSPYTWESLPTVPRGGDTPCLWKCYCHLEMRPKTKAKTVSLAGSATDAALVAPGRFARIFDSKGQQIGGAVQADFEAMYAEMYKARQMVEITTGAEKASWIATRRRLNQAIIERAKGGQYRVVPTVSVKDLVETVKMAEESGGRLVDFLQIGVADELLFVRSDYSSAGSVFERGNRLWFQSPSGVELEIQNESDILFLLGARSDTATTVIGGEGGGT
jgi:hypothetical protein